MSFLALRSSSVPWANREGCFWGNRAVVFGWLVLTLQPTGKVDTQLTLGGITEAVTPNTGVGIRPVVNGRPISVFAPSHRAVSALIVSLRGVVSLFLYQQETASVAEANSLQPRCPTLAPGTDEPQGVTTVPAASRSPSNGRAATGTVGPLALQQTSDRLQEKEPTYSEAIHLIE